MRSLSIIALIGAVSLAMPAYAVESEAEAKAELKASQRAVAKDEAAIEKHEDRLERHRAEKQAAKERGDKSTQAGKSIAIGADKAAIGAKKVEKRVDQKILEKDREDVAEARGERSRDSRGYRDSRMSPSAGYSNRASLDLAGQNVTVRSSLGRTSPTFGSNNF